MSEQSLAVRQALGVERLGEIMWKSGYWQDTRSQAQAIVKILAGAELDFGPIASMNGVYIIEGRTTMSANLVGAAIQRSGRYRYRVVEHDAQHCVIDFFEINGLAQREKLGSSSFDLNDAKAAGLLDKRGGNWQKFPRNMVFSRALTNGARWYTPDVFSGPVYTPDELGAELDAEGNVVDIQQVEQVAQGEPVSAPAPVQRVADRMVVSADEPVWQRWLQVSGEAMQWGARPPKLTLPMSYTQLVNTAIATKAKTQARQQQLAEQDALNAAVIADREAEPPSGEADAEPLGPQDDLPAPSRLADAWARNRALMAEVYAAGTRNIRDLPNNATLEQVDERNERLQAALVKGS